MIRILAIFLSIVALLPYPKSVAAEPARITFNEHIRPILSNNCFYCHGPDAKHQEADLRLDTFDGATADRGGYAAIVPGKPDESALLERVSSHDPDTMMPPPASKKPHLTDNEIATLRRWIAEGAEYQSHWAFLPLAAVAPPVVKDVAWPRNEIDHFILARLDAVGLKPSPPADRATLIRRVSLDLVGLLPTPEDVAQFVGDNDPQAYEKLVDRLLASPHYGERWGRHWLDQARYADSHGYSVDSARTMWPYRDWVIQALNNDMPFDRFTIEQLAGDLLPNPTTAQRVATGFHRNTLINEEGGTDREQFRIEAVMDRVNTTGAVWLGLTVACAQCHSHKFDPISHHEYYHLMAFFNSTTDVNNAGETVAVRQNEMFESQASPDEIDSPDRQLANRRIQWESAELTKLEARLAETTSPTADWQAVNFVELSTASNAGFQRLDYNSLLSDGRGSFNDTYFIRFNTPLPKVSAIRLRVLTHNSLPKTGPGRASNGNFVLTDLQVYAGRKPVGRAAAWADHEQPGYPAIAAIDNDPRSGWAINVGPQSANRMNANHEVVVVLSQPIISGDQPIEIRLLHGLNQNYLIGRLAIEVSAEAPRAPLAEVERLVQALQTDALKRTAPQQHLLQTAFELAHPDQRFSTFADKPVVAQQMVMKELNAPRPTFLLTRGDFTRPDKDAGPLAPGGIAAIAPAMLPTGTFNRLDLARWLVDPRNPLTPRVTMNRIWMRYFGRGLVETEEDFGSQGSAPTHPELLDWLGRELIRRGWSQKQMHRLIVTSATYQQSSAARPDATEVDPRNLLLARQERLRLEAEIIRDAALCASGLLDRTVGGPSVHPPQPTGVYSFTQTGKTWNAAVDANRYRRGLYTFFYRSAPYPLFSTFDAPNFQTVCTRRPRSNNPLQALTIANDIAFLEMAQALAARLLGVSGTSPAQTLDHRIDPVFELCVSRKPDETERDIARQYYQRCLSGFKIDTQSAATLLNNALKSSANSAEAAALVCLARTLLNTDNFISRE